MSSIHTCVKVRGCLYYSDGRQQSTLMDKDTKVNLGATKQLACKKLGNFLPGKKDSKESTKITPFKSLAEVHQNTINASSKLSRAFPKSQLPQ